MTCPSSDASLANSGKDSDIPFPMSFWVRHGAAFVINRRRSRDRQDLTQMLGERLAEALGIRRDGAPAIPLNDQRLSKRFAPWVTLAILNE